MKSFALTLAQCVPDSGAQELVNSLMAAQDYRVLPGDGELHLDMPAAGPELKFVNVGTTPQP